MQDGGVDLKDKEKIRIQKPKKYKVIFHNDDYTPMDFEVTYWLKFSEKVWMTHLI